ncbi:sigma-70 family RNA polymerase sigma factor [Oryzobacter sp. R7]|uniref:sigma-70 family RNA polymerase sigma factor n=1 Tax=Oryzobacter faecalis TaxID=3388656 RepID=UPI00398C8C9B
MSGQAAAEPREPGIDGEQVAALLPMLRRIVAARVGSHPSAEDLVQEALVRVLDARDRIEPGMLEPYAITTVRNLVATMWRSKDRDDRNLHRALDPTEPERADQAVVVDEERVAMAQAVARLDDEDRAFLLAHDVEGQGTGPLAEASGSTAGAVAARLKRTRARLRVEYLLALNHVELPTDRCSPVLLAVSAADRRRQREVDAAQHLLECEVCASLAEPLAARGPTRDDEVTIPIEADPDIVTARKAAREMASRAGLEGTDLTLIATAVSEVSRNIVRFAGSGEVVITLVAAPAPGVRVVARDAGPGIEDVPRALTDGYSTYHGLGLGLPGARRLMDEFDIVSEPGRGTTVSMTKWTDRKARP